MQRVQLTPQTNLQDLVKQVHDDKLPRLIEQEGKAHAVISSVEPTPAETVHAFYQKMTGRPVVRDLLSRLARE